MRKVTFVNDEYYHIYNRGVDKRNIFSDSYDVARFFQSMSEFNTIEPIGSIYENTFRKTDKNKQVLKRKSEGKLVNFICYCLNPNHFHFIIEQIADRGVEKFMHRVSTGYTKYFNGKYDRIGSLFQGRYKAEHVDSNEYFLHLSAYVNLNYLVHQLGSSTSKSSWEEYTGEARTKFCSTKPILDQFKNQQEYKKFARESVEYTLEKRKIDKELSSRLLE